MRAHGVLVSIHDVTPAHQTQVLELWELCRTNGFTAALLVVPYWHGNWPLSEHAEFAAWLRQCSTDGAEIVLHGLRHDEVGTSRTVSDHMRAFGRTDREGEFLALSLESARARIEEGLSMLRSQGLEPGGFIPPAWLAREGTHEAVREAGLQFSEDAGGVRLHTRNVRIAAPAIRWSGRTRVRAAASGWVNQLRRHYCAAFQRQRIVRLALHPQDLLNPVTAASVRNEVPQWAELMQQIRYDQLL